MTASLSRIAATLLPAAIALAPVPALAASDYLLKIEDLKGEAAATIEVQSWSWGASNPASAGSGGMSSGRRMHEPIRLDKPLAVNGTVKVITARENSSGMATGRGGACAGADCASPSPASPSPQGKATNLNSSRSNALRQGQPADGPPPAAAETSNLNLSKSNINRQGQPADGPPPPPAESANLNLSKSNINGQGQPGEASRTCASGKHFPRATLTGKGQIWELRNIVISSCAADGMTLSYASVAQIPAAPAEGAAARSKSNITNN